MGGGDGIIRTGAGVGVVCFFFGGGVGLL